jgi:hypothetical protein
MTNVFGSAACEQEKRGSKAMADIKNKTVVLTEAKHVPLARAFIDSMNLSLHIRNLP